MKNEGKNGRWFSPLELRVIPHIGNLPIEKLTANIIRNVLAPLWHEKADTARKALNRINICLKYAAALGLEVDLQACMKARRLFRKAPYYTNKYSCYAMARSSCILSELG